MSSCRLSSIVIAAALAAGCSRGSRGPTYVVAADDWGRGVAIRPAMRIVSLAPATTELAFALGLGDRLVGRTTWCDFPAAARGVPDVGAGIRPNIEAVAARHPDLVLLYASEANRGALREFEQLGITVAVMRVDRAEDVRRAARLLATLAGRPAAGDSLVAAFDTALAMATASPAGRRPRVYVDVQSEPPLTVGAGSYLSEIVEAAGGENVFGDVTASSAPVSLEAIVARDPDAVLVLRTDTTRGHDLDRRAGWQVLRAVREHHVLVLPGVLYDRPSPRMPQAVRDLAARLRTVPVR